MILGKFELFRSRSGSVWAVLRRNYGNDRCSKNRTFKLEAYRAVVAYGIARRIIPRARGRRGFFQRHARSEPGMLQQHPRVVPLYVSLMAMEWGLFVWVWRGGLRKTGTKLRELIGGKWASATFRSTTTCAIGRTAPTREPSRMKN